MTRYLLLVATIFGVSTSVCCAQKAKAVFPETLVIARHFFFDFGPPNDYYELTRISQVADGLLVDRVLVTPTVDSCLKTATLESHSVTLHKTFPELLQGRSPCGI